MPQSSSVLWTRCRRGLLCILAWTFTRMPFGMLTHAMRIFVSGVGLVPAACAQLAQTQ